jgi:sulfate/thiosulfate-binding protein
VFRPTSRAVASLLASLIVLSACGGGAATVSPRVPGSSGAPGGTHAGQASTAAPAFSAAPGAVTLVAYSTPKAAYDSIIKLFQATPAGQDVTFEESYGASGDQSRAVEAGLAADVVAFSLAPDVTRLVKDRIVAADWDSGTYSGMVTDSVVVFVVRKGNPRNIHTWDDLTKPGVGVIEPNPFTSGGARWNVMAAWGAQTKQGKSDAQAQQYLAALFGNVLVQDSSARAALQTFVAGQGDVMLAYENEAIQAQLGGQDIDYVVPDQTILIENPVAVTNAGDQPDKAKAFVDFLTTPDAQDAYAAKGYRPVVPDVLAKYTAQFPQPSGLFTIDDLGGWGAVTTKFFDKTSGIVAQIEQGLGINP